jgi:hypothetical protein
MCVPEQLLMSVMSARRDEQLSLLLQHHQLSSNQVRHNMTICANRLHGIVISLLVLTVIEVNSMSS